VTGGGASIVEPRRLRSVYECLFRSYGAQGWWPGETAFEVMIGAILTQNTSWSNVERAIASLKREGLLNADAIIGCPLPKLARVIRPAGYFNIKAQRLRNLCLFLNAHGGPEALGALPDPEARGLLLSVNGVGPETADDILLYGLQRPAFVIDAYTRRIFARLGVIQGGEPYEGLRQCFESALGAEVGVFQEYHALIVRHAKQTCRKRPACAGCCLHDQCSTGQETRFALGR